MKDHTIVANDNLLITKPRVTLMSKQNGIICSLNGLTNNDHILVSVAGQMASGFCE